MLDFVAAFTVASSLSLTSPALVLASSTGLDTKTETEASTTKVASSKTKKPKPQFLDGPKKLVLDGLILRLGDKRHVLERNEYGSLDYVYAEVMGIFESGGVVLLGVEEPRKQIVLFPGNVKGYFPSKDSAKALYRLSEEWSGQTQFTKQGQAFLIGGFNRLSGGSDKKDAKIKIIHMTDKVVYASYVDDPKQLTSFSKILLKDEIQIYPKKGTWITAINGKKFKVGDTYYYNGGLLAGVADFKIVSVSENLVKVKQPNSKVGEFGRLDASRIITKAELDSTQLNSTLGALGEAINILGGGGSSGSTECARDPQCAKETIYGLQPRQ